MSGAHSAVDDVYDCIVIGLGGHGSSVMAHLAKEGLKVAGFEQFDRIHKNGDNVHLFPQTWIKTSETMLICRLFSRKIANIPAGILRRPEMYGIDQPLPITHNLTYHILSFRCATAATQFGLVARVARVLRSGVGIATQNSSSWHECHDSVRRNDDRYVCMQLSQYRPHSHLSGRFTLSFHR